MCYFVENSEVFRATRTRAARKAHVCGCCGDVIAPGSDYLYVFFVNRGEDPVAYKECRRCNYDRQRIVSRELAAGCHASESNPGYPDWPLLEALREEGMATTAVPDVPAEFEVGSCSAVCS